VDTTCKADNNTCYTIDTDCSQHMTTFYDCKWNSDHQSCIECRNDFEEADYDPYRSTLCGECYSYCADKHHHREYSLEFNYDWECMMTCGESEFTPMINTTETPTIVEYYDCVNSMCSAEDAICTHEAACTKARDAYEVAQGESELTFC